MKGILFANFEVELDDRMADPMGGAWQGPLVDGKLTAWDSDVVHSFWQAMYKLDEPVVLDIGASTGSFCLLAKFGGVEKVIAFEPVPLVCSILRSNVKLNGIGDIVQVHEKALSDVAGRKLILKIPERKDLGVATLGTPRRVKAWREHEVAVSSIDAYRFEQVNLVKIDTEGAELSILLGGEETIRTLKPSILFEYEARNTAQFGYKPQELVDLLKSWGYGHFWRVGRDDMWATV